MLLFNQLFKYFLHFFIISSDLNILLTFEEHVLLVNLAKRAHKFEFKSSNVVSKKAY